MWTAADPDAFIAGVKDRPHDHGVPPPIDSSHLPKTSLAVFREVPAASDGTAEWLLASLNRFLNSPFRANHVGRLMR